MNKIKLISCILIFLHILFSADAQELQEAATPSADTSVVIKPFIIFNGGISVASVTRIIKQKNVSNFVWNDFMPGLYLSAETKAMQPINSIYRLAVYYPYSFTFRNVPQTPKNVMRYAVDFFAGVLFEPRMWHFFNFNIAPGIHFLYQTGDKWNYINLGAGGMAGIEFPITRRWTISLNGFLSFDYGNLGTNASMQPFDIVYQYQLDLGIRYSKKAENKTPYFKFEN